MALLALWVPKNNSNFLMLVNTHWNMMDSRYFLAFVLPSGLFGPLGAKKKVSSASLGMFPSKNQSLGGALGLCIVSSPFWASGSKHNMQFLQFV